jgi:hypothetical protein
MLKEIERFVIWLCDGFAYMCIAMIAIASLGVVGAFFGFIQP